ncbi:InlB B-repeat-containing protein [Breznakia pachnodae]|uniref:Uncharacterized protein n=1 Tax=Breznakia pachnodae TaxID=265178 RepID=A0ABU0E1L5_9FIRM|nr:InlB B-repeat-containing protein [Breznakia pachnodae]MDQ0360777.1 hypothetical protein [Breznakia pachnodae]
MKKVRGFLLFILLLALLSVRIQAEEMIDVNFYDEYGNLISSQELSYGEEIVVPTVLKDGYNFIGFNTQPNGNGEYLNSDIAIKSQNYYAVYMLTSYQVMYYLDNELIHTETISYGNNAPNISVSNKEGYQFSGWNGLSNITEDRSIYAVYTKIEEIEQKEEVKETEKYSELELINKDEKIQEIERSSKESDIIASPSLATKEKQLQQKNGSRLISGIFVFLGSFILFYIFMKKMNFKKKN